MSRSQGIAFRVMFIFPFFSKTQSAGNRPTAHPQKGKIPPIECLASDVETPVIKL